MHSLFIDLGNAPENHWRVLLTSIVFSGIFGVAPSSIPSAPHYVTAEYMTRELRKCGYLSQDNEVVKVFHKYTTKPGLVCDAAFIKIEIRYRLTKDLK